MKDAFNVVHSGFVGQEIIDPDGLVVAWTIDVWVAQVIAKLLNENQELIKRENERCEHIQTVKL
jgi:hypothetical protein